MALLDGLIRKEIAKGFKGRLLKGSVIRVTPGGGLNELGDPIASTESASSCEGMVESFSATYRSVAGIPDTDVKILLIAGLTAVTPKKDDKVVFRGVTYQIRKVLEIDPATATYTLQGYAI